MRKTTEHPPLCDGHCFPLSQCATVHVIQCSWDKGYSNIKDRPCKGNCTTCLHQEIHNLQGLDGDSTQNDQKRDEGKKGSQKSRFKWKHQLLNEPLICFYNGCCKSTLLNRYVESKVSSWPIRGSMAKWKLSSPITKEETGNLWPRPPLIWTANPLAAKR